MGTPTFRAVTFEVAVNASHVIADEADTLIGDIPVLA